MDRCNMCGRQPATEISVRRQVGMIVLGRWYRYRAPLCRDHGIQVARAYLNKTLVQGWWGVISFFMNLFAVGVDLSALSKARKLDPPVGAAPTPGAFAGAPDSPAGGLEVPPPPSP